MISRENKEIVAFTALAVSLLFVLSESTTPTMLTSSVVTIGVGVIAPLLVNNYFDRKGR